MSLWSAITEGKPRMPIPPPGQPEILIRTPGGITGNSKADRISFVIVGLGLFFLIITIGLALVL